ncbi:MAG: hypothetical protein L3K07_03885 [Thermoplasmata archaeon]|nr:hypothetical protein [Thermoplasmata archaeon]
MTAVNYQFVGGSCSGWGDTTGSGGTGGAGSHMTVSLSLTNTAIFGSCTAEDISTTTPGFGIGGSNTPLTVNAGTTQTLTATVDLPSGSFSGVLTIVVTVSTAA